MRTQMSASSYFDSIPVLDEEFDKVGNISASENPTIVGPSHLYDDLAWDDQLDNGEEMSL